MIPVSYHSLELSSGHDSHLQRHGMPHTRVFTTHCFLAHMCKALQSPPAAKQPLSFAKITRITLKLHQKASIPRAETFHTANDRRRGSQTLQHKVSNVPESTITESTPAACHAPLPAPACHLVSPSPHRSTPHSTRWEQASDSPLLSREWGLPVTRGGA